MSRKCNILRKKKIITGNLVSHSKRKTKRKFLPNIKSWRLYSNILGRFIRIKASCIAVREIDCKYGLDNFLFTSKTNILSRNALKIKKMISKRKKSQDNSKF